MELARRVSRYVFRTQFVWILAASAAAHLGCSSGTTSTATQMERPPPYDGSMSGDGAAAQDAPGPEESGALPAPAHSLSFFPVQGVLDNGQPAGELYWDYRIDHGQPHVSGTNASLTFQYQDEIQTIRQATLVQTDTAAVSGSASGTTSSTLTDPIDPSTGATLSINLDTTATLSTGFSEIALTETPAMPLPGYFDRTDLDTLAIGYSENSSAISANVTATVTVNTTMDQASGTASISSSWTLVDKLATYTVLGVAYADVVKVQATSTASVQLTDSTGQTSSSTSTTTTLNWLARGIGSVYSESTTQQQSGSDTTIAELAATNLVAPGASAGDAGMGGDALEAGADAGGE